MNKKLRTLMDRLRLAALASAAIIAGMGVVEGMTVCGTYHVECIKADGTIRWTDTIENQVMTVGKNLMLDSALAGASYTVTGPYMGLISSTSFTGYSAADTMASHAGWLEAGNANAPTYTGTRKTCAWSAASGGSKALSAALSFAITSSGTLQGAFINYGSAATNVIDATTGTLLSAGTFTTSTRPVINGDTVNVSYSLAL